MFCLYTVAAYKGFGTRGALVSIVLIAVFGAVAPSVTPLLVPGLFGTTAAAFVPVQTLFGPAAFAGYWWLSRSSRERTTAEWLAEQAARPARPAPAARPRAALALPGAAVVALVVATIAGAGDTTATGVAAAAPSAGSTAGDRVAMRNVAFSPDRITVRIGQTVTWTNEERVPHDVAAVSGPGFHSSKLLQGATYSWRASAPGTVRYVCTVHQGMGGTITVTG